MFGLFKATRRLEFVHRPVFKKHKSTKLPKVNLFFASW